MKIVPLAGPSLVSPERYSQNGDVPSQICLRRVAQSLNTTSRHRRKMIVTHSNEFGGMSAPATSSEIRLRFCFRTGENTAGMRATLGVAPASTVSGSNTASCRVDLTEYDVTLNPGAMTSSPESINPSIVAASEFAPGEITWGGGDISVSPNTWYLGEVVQSHYSRLASFMVHEIANYVADSTVVGTCDITLYETGKAITDAGTQDMAVEATTLWRHNAAHLISWMANAVAGVSVTSATYVNIDDAAVSTVTAASPGVHINTEHHDSQAGDVPVELGIYADLVSGAGSISVKFVDASGTLIEKTGLGSKGQLDVATGTMVAKASTKTDIQVKIVGGGEWAIHCIGLWEYEA